MHQPPPLPMETSPEDDFADSATGNEAKKIPRVGPEYQAVCPEFTPLCMAELSPDRDMMCWAPSADVPESKIEEYIALARDKYNYNIEQALAMLFWHKNDFEQAVLDLGNFTPIPDDWSLEDEVQPSKRKALALQRMHSDLMEEMRPNRYNLLRVNAKWTNDERLLAVQGVRKYGKDFKKIADELGNKTENQVRTFFVNHKKRFNLDAVLKEFENDKGPIAGPSSASNDQDVIVIDDDDDAI